MKNKKTFIAVFSLQILVCLFLKGEVVFVRPGLVRVTVDQRQEVISVRAGGVSQIDHCNLVTVVFLRDGAVISRQIAFGVQS